MTCLIELNEQESQPRSSGAGVGRIRPEAVRTGQAASLRTIDSLSFRQNGRSIYSTNTYTPKTHYINLGLKATKGLGGTQHSAEANITPLGGCQHHETLTVRKY